VLSGRKFWGIVAAIQITGAVLVILGAGRDIAVNVGGLALLLPGSVIAAILPLEKLWHPILWRLLRTDPWGLSDALYLPVAIAANLLVGWAIRILQRRYRNRLDCITMSARLDSGGFRW